MLIMRTLLLLIALLNISILKSDSWADFFLPRHSIDPNYILSNQNNAYVLPNKVSPYVSTSGEPVAVPFDAIKTLLRPWCWGKESAQHKKNRKDCATRIKNLTRKDFIAIFADQRERQLSSIGGPVYKNPQSIFSRYDLYQNSDFRSFIAEISGCYEHSCMIQARLRTDKKFAKAMDSLPGLKKGAFKKILNKFVHSLLLERLDKHNEALGHEQELKNISYRNHVLDQVSRDRYMVSAVSYLCCPDQYKQQRIEAIKEYMNGRYNWGECTYQLSPGVENILRVHDIDVDDYTYCYGISMQQSVHQECIAVLEGIARESGAYNNTMTESLVRCLHAGRLYNQAGCVAKAYAWLDLCWTLLDCCCLVSEGVFDGVMKVADNVIHPIRTIKGMTHSVVLAGHCLAKVLAFYGEFFIFRDPDNLVRMCNGFDAVYAALSMYVRQHPRETLREASSLITQAVLMQVGTKALHEFFADAAVHMPEYLEYLDQQMPPLSSQVLQAQTMAPAIAHNAMATLAQAYNVRHDIALLSEIVNKLGPYMPLGQHLPDLEKIYKKSVKGFGDCEGTFVEWQDGLKHIFEPSVKQYKNGKLKIDGFHHDYLNQLENIGEIQLTNKVMCEEGFYKAEVAYRGANSPKTFFPADWSREKLVQVLLRFTEKHKDKAVLDRGAWKIEEYFHTGIRMRVIISKNMQLISAYPIFDLM
jgi:hypothetical protein